MVKLPVIVVAAAVLVALHDGAHADMPAFKFIAAETTLPKPPERTVKLLLEGTQLGSSVAEPSEVAEAAAGPIPANYAITPIERSGSTRHWQVTAAFPGEARLAPETRYVTFNYGGTAYALSFKLTERSYDWTVVSLATDLSLYPGEGLPISISSKESGANGIHIAQTALVGQPNGTLVKDGWVLCDDPGENPARCSGSLTAASGLSVAANSDHTFWLRPRADDVLVGKYTGHVLVSSIENPGGISIPFTVYGTAIWRQVCGVIVIIASVFLSWVFGTYFHNKANRLQMLRPFAALRERARILSDRFGKLPHSIKDSAKAFSSQLASLLDDLKEGRLTHDNIVPESWFSALPQPSDAAEAYKQELAKLSDKLALLQMVMEEGFQRLAQMPPSATTADAAAALADIAAAAKVDPDTTADDIKDALAKAYDQKTLVERVAPRIQEPSVREIDITLREMSILTWILFGVIATLVGSYILVLGVPGFGHLADYIFCILWGFGLPAGAQQLGQASLGTVTTALRIASPA